MKGSRKARVPQRLAEVDLCAPDNLSFVIPFLLALLHRSAVLATNVGEMSFAHRLLGLSDAGVQRVLAELLLGDLRQNLLELAQVTRHVLRHAHFVHNAQLFPRPARLHVI